MTTFFKSIDNKIWKAVIIEWEPPSIIANGKTTLKLEIDWTVAEDKTSLGNSRTLNAIYNGVDQNVFKLITHIHMLKKSRKFLK